MLNLDQSMLAADDSGDIDVTERNAGQGYVLGDDFEQMAFLGILAAPDPAVTSRIQKVPRQIRYLEAFVAFARRVLRSPLRRSPRGWPQRGGRPAAIAATILGTLPVTR